jgi:hypothetical protein
MYTHDTQYNIAHLKYGPVLVETVLLIPADSVF